MKIYNIEQGSDAWHRLRMGVLTASQFDKLITSTGKPSKQYDGLICCKIAEKASGIPTYVPQNFAMERGKELEQEAREYYELETGNKVEQVGFIMHDTLNAGCSPDGLIGEDGGLEIKCPLPGNHVAYLRDEKLPTKYYQQVQGNMFITGREWWDFMSYAPGLKPLIIRVERDLKFIAELEKLLFQYGQEIIDLSEKYKQKINNVVEIDLNEMLSEIEE